MPRENKPAGIKGLPQGIDVYVGDARHMTAVADGSVPFFMTSPPYWNLKNYGSPGEIGQSEYEHYLNELNEVWSECYRAASEHAVLVINVNSRRVSKVTLVVVARPSSLTFPTTPPASTTSFSS